MGTMTGKLAKGDLVTVTLPDGSLYKMVVDNGCASTGGKHDGEPWERLVLQRWYGSGIAGNDTDSGGPMESRLTAHAQRWARRMAARLIRRKDRGVTWHALNTFNLIERARHALDEMEMNIESCADPDIVADDAADAANLAMMAADAWGLLGTDAEGVPT